jgi:transposase
MPKVRLFCTFDYVVDPDYGETERILTRDASDTWEDISNEDLVLLRANLWRLFPKERGNIIVVEQMDPIVQGSVITIKELIEKQRNQQEREAAERLLTREQKRLQRLAKKQAKDEKDELELLKHLAGKYPGKVPL